MGEFTFLLDMNLYSYRCNYNYIYQQLYIYVKVKRKNYKINTGLFFIIINTTLNTPSETHVNYRNNAKITDFHNFSRHRYFRTVISVNRSFNFFLYDYVEEKNYNSCICLSKLTNFSRVCKYRWKRELRSFTRKWDRTPRLTKCSVLRLRTLWM